MNFKQMLACNRGFVMTINYKELGLVNTSKMFRKAMNEGYAIPAYNFNNLEQLQAIISACVESRSPVILQISKGAREYANETLLRYLAEGAVKYAEELGGNIPIALHLDHGDSFEGTLDINLLVSHHHFCGSMQVHGDLLNHLFGKVHHPLVILIGHTNFHNGEFRVVRPVHSLIPEIFGKFVHAIISSYNQSF